MFEGITRYVYDRRNGLVKSAVLLGGSYAVSTYFRDRLEETKERMMRDKAARESLRRRFQTTHDDVCFTIMALIPTLASQILEDMDVESLTNELQSISRASRARPSVSVPSHHQQRSESVSEVSSISDAHSDAGSVSLSSYSGSGFDGDRVSAASSSWVAHMSSSENPPVRQDITRHLSDSITSTSSSLSFSFDGRSPGPVDNAVSSLGTKTRGQLWNEVKILALTRTLTTLYTTTLLSLLTAVQLNLLARSRYIDAVREAEHDERTWGSIPPYSLADMLAREALATIIDRQAIWLGWLFGDEDDDASEGKMLDDVISEETELRFLTLSWWWLHVGWKEVAVRIRGSVESVFDDVSLKTKLSASELFVLLMDVRRRVEMDGTGSQLGLRLVSSLLPPTPETTAHVLAQGGAPPIPRDAQAYDTAHPHLHGMSPPPFSDVTRSPTSSHGDIEPSHPAQGPSHDGLTPASAIPVESPTPRPVFFPTSPSSHAHESDLSSRASPSLSHASPPPPRLRQAPTDTSDSLATSHAMPLSVDSQFDELLEQTREYLSGPDFAHALGCALDRAMEVLMDGLRTRVFVDTTRAVNPPTAVAAEGDSEPVVSGREDPEIKIRLAGLLPGLARWCQLALNATPNELVDNVMAVREVNALEAIVISDYEDRFPAVS